MMTRPRPPGDDQSMTTHRRLAGCIAIVAVGVLTGCNPAQRAKEAKAEVDSGDAAACEVERSTIDKAVQAYMLLTPDAPVTEEAMVAGGFIHEPSKLMDVTSSGAVIPAVGSVCA